MGYLEQENKNWQQSLDFFLKLQKADKKFQADMVNLGIAEALYKLNDVK